MTPELANVVVAALTLLGVLVTGYWAKGAKSEATTAKHQAKSANNNAEKAMEYGKPTGNGFAKEVRDGLGDILAIATEARNEATLARELAEQNRDAHHRHLEAHANGAATHMRVVSVRD